MLYVMATDFKDKTGGAVNIKLDADSYFKVYDSEDGTIEEHNGYEIKQLEVDMPGAFYNVYVNERFHGYSSNANFPVGVYPIPNTDEYFIVTLYHGVYVFDGTYMLRCRYHNNRDVQRCTPVLKDETGYFHMAIYVSQAIKTEIVGTMDIKRIRRAQVLNQLEDLVHDLYVK